MKRFEQSNRLDTALYKNYLYLFFYNVRAQQQDAVPDWLNPLPLGIMSASAYIDNVA